MNELLQIESPKLYRAKIPVSEIGSNKPEQAQTVRNRSKQEQKKHLILKQ
jgi:hypothetical protein